jgi:diguanylate cyclase (GGDEF)-like protein
MNRVLYDILNNVTEGIIILNEKLEICLWNNYMEFITEVKHKEATGNKIYEVLPNLNRNYFRKAIDDALNNKRKMFFSAAMHRGLVNDKDNLNLNLKISRFDKYKAKFLLLEFIDVTNQFIQINRLQDSVNKLCEANKKLKEKETVIRKLAYYDKLTGVANRTLFYELADKFLHNAKRENKLLGLMFIDVDKFKGINDTYGHEIGDKVLIKVANILKEATRRNDIVARHGGDEFLILLPNIKSFHNYEVIVSRIFNNKNKSIIFNGEEINVSLSIGIGFYPDAGDTIDKLIVAADKAMYIAKNREGENCSVCHMLQSEM